MNFLSSEVVFCPLLTDSLQSSLSNRLTTFSSFHCFLSYTTDTITLNSFQNSAHWAVVTHTAKADFGIFWVFWKIFGKLKPFFPKQPSKWPSNLQFGYFFRGLKSKSGYILGFSKKISDEHTYHFYIKSAPPPGQEVFRKCFHHVKEKKGNIVKECGVTDVESFQFFKLIFLSMCTRIYEN